MSELATTEQLELFIRQVEISRTLDWPKAAAGIGLDFISQVYPQFETQPWVVERLKKVLSAVRYELAQGLLNVARNGKSFGGGGDAAHTREVIKLIDSGVLFGPEKEEEKKAEEESPADLAEHLARLGLKSD